MKKEHPKAGTWAMCWVEKEVYIISAAPRSLVLYSIVTIRIFVLQVRWAKAVLIVAERGGTILPSTHTHNFSRLA